MLSVALDFRGFQVHHLCMVIDFFQKEHALMDDTLTPQSADDFDRRLASNPSSSVLWLQYMAHYTHVAEFDKARAVAQRALKMIPFHEEAEKLNIWTGLMNLENLYGTEETLLQVFESALKHNDPLAVFIKLVNIYVDSNKFDVSTPRKESLRYAGFYLVG